ncbi:MAG: hypothetical protein FJX80_14545 [Bacteroidetes bacterium]|nr:hypothetical protein [Bacteroidota bacterium]
MYNKLQIVRINICFKLLLFVFIFSSCYKEKKTMVTVTVKDENNTALENASVRLFAEPTSPSENMLIEDYTAYTNNEGKAYFNLTNLYQPGQTGVVVLSLEGSLNSLSGTDIITVEQEKNNRVDLVLY